MATSSLSASCSPEKVSLASYCSTSLGNVHDATAAPKPAPGSEEDVGHSSPGLHGAGEGGSKRSCSSSFSLDLDENMDLNFNPREPLHKWKKLSSCEEFVGTKRSKHTIVAWNDRIYVFGGDNGRRMLNDFLVSHIHDSSWARVVYTGMPPAPRYHHSAVVFADSMFVFGGYTGDIYSNSNLRNKNDLHQYKFTTSQWLDWEDRIEGALPPARSAHGAAVYDNRLWIFAGYDGHTRLNDMWCISLTDPSPRWTQVEQVGDSPPTCCNFPVAVVEDSMFVFSGQSGAKITNKLYQFHFRERRWVRIRTEHLVQASAPPQRRYGHTMVAYRRSLYVYGGAADGILDNVVHCFDVDTRSWSVTRPAEGSEVPCGRVFHSAAVWNNRMYVFGGTIDSLSNRSGDLFRFSLPTFPKCSLVNDFTGLLAKESFCDIHFVLLDGAVVKAHVVVVVARSLYLRRRIREAYTSGPQPLTEERPTTTAHMSSPLALMEATTTTAHASGLQAPMEAHPTTTAHTSGPQAPMENHPTTTACMSGLQALTEAHSTTTAHTSGPQALMEATTTTAHASGPQTPMEDPLATKTVPLFTAKEPISLHLADVSGEVFKFALHSLYTDRIHPDLENHSCKETTVSQMLLMVDVYKLSLLLETKRLELLSIKYIEASINEENVLLVLKNATELGLSSLKDYCMRFIIQDSHYRKVVMGSTFETLDKHLMVQIIRRQLFRSRPTSPDPPSSSSSSSSSSSQDQASSLQDDLKAFLDSETGRPFADIVLRVGDQAVLAHRAILIARCSYFEALFRSFMPESGEVEITFGDVVPSLSAFMSLLRYTYCGEIEVSPEDSLYVFSAPNFFGFANSRLHCHCKAILEREVHQENVLNILETADTINLQVMKKHCLDMIAAHFPSIVQQGYFRSLRRELLLDIFDILASRMVE